MSELMLDVGQANELKMAFRREGQWTNEKIKMLTEQKGLLTQVLAVLDGFSEIKPMEFVIDCDAIPVIPSGLSIEKHVKGGAYRWVNEQIRLHLSKKQKNGKVVIGHDLRQELESESVLNACVLDFLLKNPHLIPEEWKGKSIFFWGTIYRNAIGNLYVPYLYWNGGKWYSRFSWLGSDWNDNNPAACGK